MKLAQAAASKSGLPISLLVIVLLAVFSFSAAVDAEQPETVQNLPIGFTAEELTRLHEIGMNFSPTAAPTGDIRNPAEWEPSEGVIIRWPLGISVALVAEMSEDLMVTTIVGSTSERNSAISSYTAGGVNMDHVQWLIAATNTIWTRDYGPWFIFQDEQLAIVDHVYNRPRPQDDVIPAQLGAAWGLNVYGMNLTTTGGNHMSDGLGRSMSTRLVWDENTGLSHAAIDSLMHAYLGNNYTVLEYIESGGIHHIDCWAKFLNPTTILIKDVASSDYRKANLDARAQYLSQQISAWGQPYTIVRIYCPSGTAYTNSIILNNKVLVPLFGSSYDSTALNTYRQAMPGYEVLGFTGSFLDDDAIHCRTMGVPDRDMLLVNHVPLAGEAGTNEQDYRIDCHISPFSDSALIADSSKVYYSTDGVDWSWVQLQSVGEPDSFYAYIPAQEADAQVRYYIQAADMSGRVQTHPYIGAPWAHTFTVTGPHAPSAPSVLNPVDTGGWPIYEMLPELSWTEASDPDPDDTIRYRVEISSDEVFTAPTIIDSIAGTSCVLTDSLAFGAQYWWRVAAFDRTDRTALSEAGMFKTWLLGDMDHSGEVSLGDLSKLIDALFISLMPVEPARLGDLDGDCQTTLGDLTKLIDMLFISLSPLTVPGCE